MITENNEGSSMNNQSWKPMRHEEVNPEIMNVLEVFVEDLPQLPVHVYKLLKIMSQSEINSKEVAKVASSDPGMVSKILKAVNSSYYGLTKKTENLHLAITILGFNEVRNIAVQSGFTKIFGGGWIYRNYDTRDLWEHSYLVSVCAETLAKEINMQETGKLLTYGILHDIGKYALYKLIVLMKKKRVRPYKYKPFSTVSYLLDKEETLFGVNHTIVGNMLSQKWGFSENICAILKYHHFPSFWSQDSIPPEYLKDVALISISDMLINLISENKNKIPEPSREYFDLLGLSYPPENLITKKLEEKLEEAREFVHLIK
ncbi:HDOD domain-containing protein [Candidatus Latescibacterota bacterium]